MSGRQRDYCLYCLQDWQAQEKEERKRTTPSRRLTSVKGIPVCGRQEHIDRALEESQKGSE